MHGAKQAQSAKNKAKNAIAHATNAISDADKMTHQRGTNKIEDANEDDKSPRSKTNEASAQL